MFVKLQDLDARSNLFIVSEAAHCKIPYVVVFPTYAAANAFETEMTNNIDIRLIKFMMKSW